MHRFSEFIVGLVFGWGLLISGMTDPGKVTGFLDLAGAWDPSLAFVMGGGVLVGLFGFIIAKKRTSTILGSAMHLPTSRDIDRRLVAGSLVFGAGWGLEDTLTNRVLFMAVITGLQALINHMGIKLTAKLTDFSGYLIFATAIVLTIACLASASSFELSRLWTFGNYTGTEGASGVWPIAVGGGMLIRDDISVGSYLAFTLYLALRKLAPLG